LGTNDGIDFYEQNQWEAKPDEKLEIPEAYIEQLRYEIIVFGRKKEFAFRCKDYESDGNAYRFTNVIIDTSKRDPDGEVILKRLTYHPEVILANVGFLAIPAIETNASDAHS